MQDSCAGEPVFVEGPDIRNVIAGVPDIQEDAFAVGPGIKGVFA